MQEPMAIVNLEFDNQKHPIKVYGNVDRIDGFYYYTFELNAHNSIVLSKFDGTDWKIANQIMNDDLANLLGKIIDNLK